MKCATTGSPDVLEWLLRNKDYDITSKNSQGLCLLDIIGIALGPEK